ncbi:aurora protein [Raphidocelis subcapitata]|uniref:Aurora protein n=1 Tax=Raphidocelis subcapitata TaxID=307507 RepID=A0A2V0NWT2_9CHLO|nr:aurora protein [Raphidocelis subcapitata]|eukprot:GBF90030.1 aurora protein [Raphidocelis subcapitata]
MDFDTRVSPATTRPGPPEEMSETHQPTPALPRCRLLHCGQGVSSVSLCECDGFGAGVAIKAYVKARMAPRHALNLHREVAILSELRASGTPGIVELLSMSETPDAVLLYFRACPGGTLLHVLRGQAWSEARLRREVALPLTRTLARIHAMGIVHRDIKPENVFIDDDGQVVLGDFGLAISRTRERAVSRVGTAGFIAPEVLAQPSAEEAAALPPGCVPTYDAKADVWSLGALLFEALTGDVPFGGPNPAAAAAKARLQPPPPLPPGASRACADFVRAALEPDPRRRPSAARLLAHPWLAAAAASPPPAAWDAEWQAQLQQRQGGAAAGWALGCQPQLPAVFAPQLHAYAVAASAGPARARPQAKQPAELAAPVAPASAGRPVPDAAAADTQAPSRPLSAEGPAASATGDSSSESGSDSDGGDASGRPESHMRRRHVFDSVDSFSEPLDSCCAAAAPAAAPAHDNSAPLCGAALAAAAAAAARLGGGAAEGRAAVGAPPPAAAPRARLGPGPLKSLLAALLCARGVSVAC